MNSLFEVLLVVTTLAHAIRVVLLITMFALDEAAALSPLYYSRSILRSRLVFLIKFWLLLSLYLLWCHVALVLTGAWDWLLFKYSTLMPAMFEIDFLFDLFHFGRHSKLYLNKMIELGSLAWWSHQVRKVSSRTIRRRNDLLFLELLCSVELMDLALSCLALYHLHAALLVQLEKLYVVAVEGYDVLGISWALNTGIVIKIFGWDLALMLSLEATHLGLICTERKFGSHFEICVCLICVFAVMLLLRA